MNSSYQVRTILLFIIALLFPFQLKAQSIDSSAAAILNIRTNLDTYYLVIDDNYQEPYLVNQNDSIVVEPGLRKVTIVWKEVNDYSFPMKLNPGETHVKSVVFSTFPEDPRTSYKVVTGEPNLKIFTDKNSSIYLNGKYLGKHHVEVFAKTGEYTLDIKHPEFGSLTKNIETKIYESTLVERYNQNPSNLSLAAQLLPGAAYASKNQNIKATLTYGLLTALSIPLIKQQVAYRDKKEELNNWVQRYKKSQTTELAISNRLKAEEAQKNLSSIGQRFNTYLLAFGAVYVISTLDGIRKPRQGYRYSSDQFKAKASLSALSLNYRIVPQVTFRFSLK